MQDRDARAGPVPRGVGCGGVAPRTDYPAPSLKMSVKIDFNNFNNEI